jgi:hypothetical protein
MRCRGRVLALTTASVALVACTGDDAPSAADPAEAAAAATASTVATIPFQPESTLAAPTGIEELSAGLFGAGDVGVPDTWAVRDLDPLVPEAVRSAEDADPFLGLLDCADGVTHEGADRSWIARRFTAPETPLDNGLLSVEFILEIESAEDFAADRAALAQCQVGSQATVDVVDADLPLPLEHAVDASATEVALYSEPVEAVPYPSTFSAVVANHGGFTATAVFGGIDQGADWLVDARELVARLLVELQK